jgi:hypothetical protein
MCSGCVVGGGPIVGYSNRGLFGGVEVSAGAEAILPQATLGYQSDHQLIYLRVDETVDVTVNGYTDHYLYPGGRIGGGIGLAVENGTASTAGVFAAGFSLGHAVSGVPGSCRDTAAVLEIQVRYAAGWSIALVPRVEQGVSSCPHG